MNKIYSYAMAAAMAMTSFGAFAQDDVTVVVNPAAGSVLTEAPATFSLTFEGVASIAKPLLGGNPVVLTTPSGQTQQCPTVGNWTITDGKTFECTIPSSIDRTQAGEWSFKLKKGGVSYVDEAGVKTDCPEYIFTYTVGEEDNSRVKITLDPAANSTLEEFPEVFTMKFDGPESIKKNILAANPVKVYEPGSSSALVCTATWDNANNLITLKTHKDTDRTVPGVYTIKLVKDGVQYIFPDGTEKAEEQDFYYNVIGVEQSDDVKYDIELAGTTPKLATGFNASERTWEIIQFTFNAGDLQPVDGATATITGPNYKMSAPLRFSMGNASATWMKASFQDPVYNGTYTLTIPQGAVGNAAYLADPEKGRANAAVNLTFEVTGGKQYTGNEKQTTLNPIEVLPTVGGKVETLNFVILNFEEDVYYNEGLTFKVGIKEDPAAMAFSNFGTATVTGSGNSVRLNIEPKPTKQAEYMLTIPESSFRNAENAADATNFNSALSYNFLLRPVKVAVEVLSTDPKSGTRVQGFHIGEGITINTDNNDAVAKMDVTVTAYILDNESAAPQTVLSATTTTKNAEGAICWLADKDYAFSADNYYEVAYTLYDEAGVAIYDSLYDFDGADGFVLVEAIFGNDTPKTIYNMQGMRVGDDIHALPAGIYIVNGKKLIIRK